MQSTERAAAVLANERVRLAFEPWCYCPVNLADARRPEVGLFALMAAHYTTKEGTEYAEAYPPGKRPPEDRGRLFDPETMRFGTKGSTQIVEVRTRSPHFRLTKRFSLRKGEPWVRVKYSIVSTGAPVQSVATQIQVPAMWYGPGMENPLEADFVTFHFGAIHAKGTESPPWLSFWANGRQHGCLVWTENREMMRRIIPRDAHLCGAHPSLECGSSDLANKPWNESDFRKPMHWEFCIWPIRRSEWKGAAKELAQMRFESWKPSKVFFSKAPKVSKASKASKGRGRDRGLTLTADEIARRNRPAVGARERSGRWWHVKGKALGTSLLFAQEPWGTAPLVVKHGLRGRYRITLGINGGAGIQMRLAGAKFPIPFMRESGTEDVKRTTPFYNTLIERPADARLELGAWDLDGRPLELTPSPGMYDQTIVQWIHFEPEAAIPTAGRRQLPLAGVCDTPDIAHFDGTISDKPYRANAAEHAHVGFQRVYWRADGQCCDYHTKVGTVRYPVLRTHSLFNPSTLSYGLSLRKHDLLKVAVEEAHRRDLEIYGYMRLNGFAGNVTAQFYRDHPELHDEREIGGGSQRMSYYLPAFRKWKVEIAREIVQHQVDGLLLDLTRSPPMIEYHPTLVKAYEQRYGEPPPRNHKRGYVSYGIHPLETGEPWTRWWRFRAEGFTQFGREIRQMLKEEGKPDLPIHVQVRPKMALFDGLDLRAWIDEGLVDLLTVWPTDFEVPQEIFDTVRDRVSLWCTVSVLGGHGGDAERWAETVLKDPRYQGLTLYESDAVVWSARWRGILGRLQRTPG